MSEADQTVWVAILKSKRAVQSACELWSTVRWSILGTGLVFAIWQAVRGCAYSEAIKLIMYSGIFLGAHEIAKIVLSKSELAIVRAEADLAERIVC